MCQITVFPIIGINCCLQTRDILLRKCRYGNLRDDILNKEIRIEMSDFITIRHQRIKPAELKKKLDHVIITSQNAVESLIDSADGSPLDFGKIYCVGRRTKRLIEKRIGKVSYTANSALKLAEHLVAELKEPVEFTFFCGDLRRDELPQMLTSHGHQVNEIVSYQTLLTPNELKNQYQGILFFSPSGIESYLKKNKPKDEVAFCIGSTTSAAGQTAFKTVIEAKNPSVEAVIQSVNDYFQTYPGA